MDNGGIGFLLGAVPGVAFALRNMLWWVRSVAEARKMVQERGERFDVRDDISATSGLIFKALESIRASDGPAVREAKEMLLARRDKFYANHLTAIFLLGGRTLIGAFLGVLYGPLIRSLS
ncbi:hypothetical protein FIV34_17605 [Luteibacter pinisoli]|uniref:Uncharacterized protein n=1 Tax=Luteibacter pinisoli TaxID=2589080 RepID=A0A4Y5Z7E8_9GAMM|nr:hypothetical protein [Luteibacter pinisoli]QDE40896.1 hypothetical protein FIV34_17605 [Luteibacter pinisoli]